MKKTLLLFAVGFATHNLQAQVGINTTDPKVTLNVNRNNDLGEEAPQGVLFPKFSTAERTKFQNTPEGTLIYNTTKKCIEMYQGIINGAHQWECLPGVGSTQSQNIAVSPAGFEGQYIGGVPLNNSNKVKFKLQNNGFSAISNVDFSNAVYIQNGTTNNVQVTPNQNNNISLASGAETILTYKLTGTPETGNLTATFNRLGLQADQSIQVGLGSATIQDKAQYVVSMVYNSTTIQGKINNGAEKITLQIPYTNGEGSYNGVNITQTTAPGQGNDINELTLKIQPNTFNASGYITGTIEVGGGDSEYLVRQLAPGASYDIATFDVDMNGNNYQVILKGIGGIPDKEFGNGYDYIYLPVEITGSNGYNETWLNMNLRASAAGLNSSDFNPTKVKTGHAAHNDPTLFGQYFQFSEVKQKNPCPNGYRLPTEEEWSDLHLAVTGTSGASYTSKMYLTTLIPNLSATGAWRGTGVLRERTHAYYWSSTEKLGEWTYIPPVVTREGMSNLGFDANFSYAKRWTSGHLGFGYPVRCLKD